MGILRSILRSLSRKARSRWRPTAFSRARFRPWLETLEDRTVLTAATFVAPAASLPGVAPVAVAAGDFNGDGKADLVTANATTDNVSVLLGQGGGAFQALTSFATGSGPRAVAVADFNGDGRFDLVTANSTADTVSILFGNGDGTFGAKADYTVGGAPLSVGLTAAGQTISSLPAPGPAHGTVTPVAVAVGDFNGDGRPDIVTANAAAGSVSILLNKGDGTFTNKGDVAPLNFHPEDVVVADFNGDGRADLATADPTGTVSIVLGNGDGTFAVQNTYGTTSNLRSIAVGDLNGDGRPDVVAAGTVAEVLLNQGNTFTLATHDVLVGSTIQPSPAFVDGTNAQAVVLGDFNGDGRVDVVTADAGPIIGQSNGTIDLLLGNGDGTLQAPTSLTIGPNPTALITGDLNGDGHPDLVTANPNGGTVSVLLGTGAATFGTRTDFSAGFDPAAAATGDFNGDGRPDLVTAGPNSLSVSLGQGDGTFQAATTLSLGATPVGVAVGDFNGDGLADIATANNNATVSILLGLGGGRFQAPVSLAAGAVPASLVVGDFNGDGIADIATANTASNTVSVLLGSGDGTLQAATTYATGTGPQTLVAGDFNGDGRADLVTGNATTLSVLLSNGDGTFQPHTDTSVVFAVHGLAASDFNGDGRLDLVAGSGAAAGMVGVLLGNGDGSFSAPTTFAAGAVPSAVLVGDFNGDGRADVATTNAAAGTASILLGNGDGTLQAPASFAAGVHPRALVAADFNGDGRLDLAAVNAGPSALNVLLGNGDGTLRAPVVHPTGAGTTATYSGDFNGDGIPDLLVPGNAPEVLLANGDGTFRTAAGGVASPMLFTTVADFNGDGKLDVFEIGPSNGVVNPNYLFLGNGEGTFQAPAVGSSSVTPTGLAAGDFNGDGKADLLLTWPALSPTLGGLTGGAMRGRNSLVTGGASAGVVVEFGLGDGTFQGEAVSPLSDTTAHLAVGDFNNDGKLDMAVTISTPIQGFVDVLTGNGDGTFQDLTTPQVDLKPNAIAVGDFNGDGNADLAVSSDSSNMVDVLTGQGNGIFGPGVPLFFNGGGAVQIRVAQSYPAYTAVPGGPTGTFGVTVGDFNQDGLQDLAVGTPLGASVLLGNGDGSFQPGKVYDAGASPHSLAVGDFNGDGFPDLAVASSATGAVTVLQNTADVSNLAGATSFRVSAGPAIAGTPFSVTVAAVDAAGNPVTGFRGTIHFSSSDPRAQLPAFYTFTAADAGTHTFASTVTLFTAGNDTVTATNPRMTPASATVAVSPAAASRFMVGAPSAASAGTSLIFTLTAFDAYGNVATGYTGTVSFSSSDAQAGLPASYTFTTADAGVHSLSATLKTAGAQSITAKDSVLSSVSGTSATISVSPAAASTLALAVTPGSLIAGTAGTLSITALDPYGNVATGYTGTVRFSSSDAQAILPADTVLTSGVASGLSVTLKAAGTQSLTATDTVTATLTGTAVGISVSPAAASSFVVSDFPATTAGVAHSITVTAFDAYGNVATGYTGTVHLTSSDGQAALPADYTFTAADAGVHTFTATLKTAGTQSITATDSTSATITGSATGISVSPAAAALFTVTGFPATTAGVGHTFTVTARDAFGNVATGYAGTVNFSSSDVQAGLPASYTFTAADSGVHTFTATLKTAGTQSITVTDATDATVTGSETGIAVSAAAATHFAISAPSTATAGKLFTFTVTALDDFGNVATGYLGKVHFTDTAGSSNLPSDYTFTAADAGVHTFSATLNAAVLQTITVTDTATSSISGSASILVSKATSGSGGATGGGGGGTSGGGGGGGGGSGH